MAPNDTVSVVVANHDHGRFVVEAVTSALEQTHPPQEVIVVDDASADDSVRRLRRRFGRSITLVPLPTNVGQVRAVQVGVAAASGSIVCFLDADDRWHPGKIERVLDAFVRRPAITQLSHGLRSIDAEGRPRQTRPQRHGGRARRRLPLNEGDVRSVLFRWNQYGCAVTSGLSYPRWVLDAALPAPERFATRGCYVDAWSTVAAAFLGPVGALHEDLMDYRVHGANAVGGSTDFERAVAHWRLTGEMIDHWARRCGDHRRADPERRDNRLLVARYLAGEPIPLGPRLRALAETPFELRAMSAQPLDGAVRTIERAVMVASRRRGAELRRVGLSRWLRGAR
ncbi:MAG: glycosyltransferase [Vicinamibacterales bacterium]